MLQTYLLVLIVPMVTLLTVFLLWHSFGEHIREKESCLSANTFTHKFGILATLVLYPIQSSYHLEHHLYPQLPWHSMKKFRACAEKNPEYKRLAGQLKADGYFIEKKTIVKMAFSE